MISREEKLKFLLTDEFLHVICEALRVYGDTGDSVENLSFAKWCFSVAEKDCPPNAILTPYPVEEL